MNFNQCVKDDALEIFRATVNIRELVRFLQSNTYITKLSLKWAKIDDEGVKELAKLTHLTSLNLQSNIIGNKGAEALANGNLTRLVKLVCDLWLNYTNSLDEGNTAKYILTSLEKRRNREMEESTSSSGSDSDDPSNKLSEVRSASHNWSHRTQGDWWSHEL